MPLRDSALAAMVAVIWGIAFLATEFALQSFTPPQLTALRFILAAVPVLFIAKPNIGWGMLIALGTFLFTGQFLLLFFGFEAGMPPGVASVVTHTQAMFTIVLAVIVLGERPNRRQLLGLVIAGGGLICVAMSVGGNLTILGLGFTLAGALSWSVGNILLKRLKDVDMLSLMIWLSLVPPLPALVLALWLDGDVRLYDALLAASNVSLLAVLYLGIISTALAYAIWGRLLNTYAAVQVTPFALFAPCAGVIASYFVFGETVGLLRGAGMALVFAGVALTILRFRG